MSDVTDTREAVYKIEKANDISSDESITAGQTLKIPVSE
jgi:hypothetical protein